MTTTTTMTRPTMMRRMHRCKMLLVDQSDKIADVSR
jgi:hypothetical protein